MIKPLCTLLQGKLISCSKILIKMLFLLILKIISQSGDITIKTKIVGKFALAAPALLLESLCKWVSEWGKEGGERKSFGLSKAAKHVTTTLSTQPTYMKMKNIKICLSIFYFVEDEKYKRYVSHSLSFNFLFCWTQQ